MKDEVKTLIAAAFGFVLLFAVGFSGEAVAGEERVCTVGFLTTDAGSTVSPVSGTCTWGAGATLLMQCDVSVYFSTKPVSGGTRPVATSNDMLINFVSNNDPYIIYLSSGRTEVSVLGVLSQGTCKLGPSDVRKKPL